MVTKVVITRRTSNADFTEEQHRKASLLYSGCLGEKLQLLYKEHSVPHFLTLISTLLHSVVQLVGY